MEPRNQLIACVIKQYGTGLYQAWVSLDKGHTACLGSHNDEVGASETIDHFLDVYREGQIKTHKDILTHIDSCYQKWTARTFGGPCVPETTLVEMTT
jgi:hypothetical protein